MVCLTEVHDFITAREYTGLKRVSQNTCRNSEVFISL